MADFPGSSIAWLDFSEDDRRKMMEVVSLFKLRETRDELGLGSIRNVFAELLFPGTSTLQTRARYFLFVPWIYAKFEKNRVPSSKLWDRLRQDEVWLMRALNASGDTDVLIGRISGASLNRFPSSIYWNGLKRWGIFRRDIGQSEYHRSLDYHYLRQKGRRTSDDGEPMQWSLDHYWDPNLPKPPKGFPEGANMALRRVEAEYFKEMLRIHCDRSMLPYIVEAGEPLAEVEFGWMHPAYGSFPAWLQDWLNHARRFSEAMYGAALLYNYLLAEMDDREEWMDIYESEMDAWRETIESSRTSFLEWEREAFWRLVTDHGSILLLTRQFVQRWLDLLLEQGTTPRIQESKEARDLVRKREMYLKRGRSRFESKPHRELWRGASGAFQLDFRWWVAKRLTNDIIEGLGAD